MAGTFSDCLGLADHRHAHRRLLEGQRSLVSILPGRAAARAHRRGEVTARRRAEHDEAPGLELAVVGHPRRRGQQRLERRSVRSRAPSAASAAATAG
jgi:hypothetical protein